MRIAELIAYFLIIVATTFIGVAIGGAGVLIWNGIATLFDWYLGSVIQGAAVMGGFALVVIASLCVLSVISVEKTKGDDN